jgi:hypothetical protein
MPMTSINSKGSSAQSKPVVKEDEVKGHNRLAVAQGMSEEEFLDSEKSLKRKLDVRLLACFWLIFVMNYLDRVSTKR